jgi:glutamate carboxypeptidase
MIARIKPENSTGKIILQGHTETVFKEGETQNHPFRIDGEWAYGLGAADMKAGLLTFLYALKIMQEADLLPDKEICILLNCDEEIGSFSSQKFFHKEYEGAEYAFVFEPARGDNEVYTSRVGVAEGNIQVTGIAAHAQAAYLEGSSAVFEISNIILKLMGKNDISRRLLYNVAPLSGGKSPGVIADEAHAVYCVSLTSQDTIDQAAKDVEELETQGIIKGCSIKTDFKVLFPPMERTEGNHKAYELVRDAGKIMGLDLLELPETGKSSSDACFASYYGVPTVDCIGPYMLDIHKFTERVLISSIKEKTKLFSIVLGML